MGKSNKIAISQYAEDGTVISYDDGQKCLREIEKILEDSEDNIVLDFKDVDLVITAFLNPVIGDLIIKHGIDIMKRIVIENASADTIKKIKIVKSGALLNRDALDE